MSDVMINDDNTMMYKLINLTILHSFISNSAIIINNMVFNTDNEVRGLKLFSVV